MYVTLQYTYHRHVFIESIVKTVIINSSSNLLPSFLFSPSPSQQPPIQPWWIVFKISREEFFPGQIERRTVADWWGPWLLKGFYRSKSLEWWQHGPKVIPFHPIHTLRSPSWVWLFSCKAVWVTLIWHHLMCICHCLVKAQGFHPGGIHSHFPSSHFVQFICAQCGDPGEVSAPG